MEIGEDRFELDLSAVSKFLNQELGVPTPFTIYMGERALGNVANPPDPKTFPFILLGNKIDIDGGNSRVVSEKKAKEWCASKGNIPYFETSAKEDYNVDPAFLCIAKTALANEHEQDIPWNLLTSWLSLIVLILIADTSKASPRPSPRASKEVAVHVELGPTDLADWA
ncbi:hypothetical protein GH714_019572 [Hevea brasiliensis]|uniref:Uncharacterized protein n=1 Tax=Hevea brasiliensis TaxID=3981 RepID=A0A6A6KPY0_HEVBR|nr:hypothetical protein GH714_019572 [Hevea brasiliensis]